MSTRTAKSAARTSLCFSPPVTQDVMCLEFMRMSISNRLIILSFAGMAISVIPLYGYFVHASHNSQQVGLLIILTWVLTCFFVIISFVATFVKHRRGQTSKYARYVTCYFLLAGALGYGGVYTAFLELIAG